MICSFELKCLQSKDTLNVIKLSFFLSPFNKISRHFLSILLQVRSSSRRVQFVAIAFDNALQPSMYQPFHDKFNFCKPRFCCKHSKKTLQSDVKRCVRSVFAIWFFVDFANIHSNITFFLKMTS